MVELLLDGTSVRDDSEVELRHLKLISENIARSGAALYESRSGSNVGSLAIPKRWHRKGSDVLCKRTKSAQEVSLKSLCQH